jgi:hypothetical protein
MLKKSNHAIQDCASQSQNFVIPLRQLDVIFVMLDCKMAMVDCAQARVRGEQEPVCASCFQ